MVGVTCNGVALAGEVLAVESVPVVSPAGEPLYTRVSVVLAVPTG